jgi:hypothetical protein
MQVLQETGQVKVEELLPSPDGDIFEIDEKRQVLAHEFFPLNIYFSEIMIHRPTRKQASVSKHILAGIPTHLHNQG